MIIPPWQEKINQSQWIPIKSSEIGWHNNFSPRFTYLPASWSPLWWFTHLEVHARIGITRLTRNRVSHNQHKMMITQATSNPLEYLLALHWGKVKNPSQSPRSEPETSTFLCSTIIAAPSCLGGSNHQEKQANSEAKHNCQVPLDAITQAIHLDSLSIS
jgi:hypothetical protein